MFSDNLSTIPWVEKYRPTRFDDIVLDPLNKIIMENILKHNYFPNLLLYGPPGTGKTTTIINLVNSFQEKNNQKNMGLMIHLNASDERGIDIIRNQISQFVYSQSLFSNGTKFVILDEVDYMTKNAQHALKYLLQSYSNNVRFCLICNYISRIDESLQNEFMKLRFNQLPEKDIINFLNVINEKEQLYLSQQKIYSIQKLYKSDIRSMINYMQTNQDIIQNTNIITNTVWDVLTNMFEKHSRETNISKNIGIESIISYLEMIGRTYNIELRTIIKSYFYYIIRFRHSMVNFDFLNKVEHIIHLPDIRHEYVIHYFVLKMNEIFVEKMTKNENTITKFIKIRRKKTSNPLALKL